MAVKYFVDEIPPIGGRVYQIVTNGTTSTITDVTGYQQEGTGFGSADVNATCILECNYAKVGNVHQLTTQNTTSENIKFFATAAYTRGDTFTFNGREVGVKTLSGGALGANFFEVNSLVTCSLKDDILYFNVQNALIRDDVTGKSYRLGVEDGVLYMEEE